MVVVVSGWISRVNCKSKGKEPQTAVSRLQLHLPLRLLSSLLFPLYPPEIGTWTLVPTLTGINQTQIDEPLTTLVVLAFPTLSPGTYIMCLEHTEGKVPS